MNYITENNAERPATRKQLWAIYCLSKKDYRGQDLTMLDASVLIQRLKTEKAANNTQNTPKPKKTTLEKEFIDWQHFVVHFFNIIFASLCGWCCGKLIAFAYHILNETCNFVTAQRALICYDYVIVKELICFVMQMCHTYDFVTIFHNNRVTKKNTLLELSHFVSIELAFGKS